MLLHGGWAAPDAGHCRLHISSFPSALASLGVGRMDLLGEAGLQAAGQWWACPLLLVFFLTDGFAMVVPSETLIVRWPRSPGKAASPNLWVRGGHGRAVHPKGARGPDLRGGHHRVPAPAVLRAGCTRMPHLGRVFARNWRVGQFLHLAAPQSPAECGRCRGFRDHHGHSH